MNRTALERFHRLLARLALQAMLIGCMAAGALGGFFLFKLADHADFVWWVEQNVGPATAKLSAMVSFDPLVVALLVPLLIALGLGLSMIFVWQRHDTAERLKD